MQETVEYALVSIVLLCLSGAWGLQLASLVKAHRAGGALLYRVPWTRSRWALLIVAAVSLFPLAFLDWKTLGQTWLGILRGSTAVVAEIWFVWTIVDLPLEFRASGIVLRCKLVPWERIREYAWRDSHSILRLMAGDEYWEQLMSPRSRAAVEAILEEHHIPPYVPSDAAHSGSPA